MHAWHRPREFGTWSLRSWRHISIMGASSAAAAHALGPGAGMPSSRGICCLPASPSVLRTASLQRTSARASARTSARTSCHPNCRSCAASRAHNVTNRLRDRSRVQSSGGREPATTPQMSGRVFEASDPTATTAAMRKQTDDQAKRSGTDAFADTEPAACGSRPENLTPEPFPDDTERMLVDNKSLHHQGAGVCTCP